MARDTIEVTGAWQKIASGPVVITVSEAGRQALLFNETASDVNAWASVPRLNQQFYQDEPKDTYAKATDGSSGWVLLVDGVL